MSTTTATTTTKTYIYKHASGVDIPAYVHFSPPDPNSAYANNAKPRPMALLFHPGGFTMGSASLLPPALLTHLLSPPHSFIVITPEYRLCPQVSLLEGPVADAVDALRWCRGTLPGLLAAEDEDEGEGVRADPNRVLAVGHSAGANLALLLGSAEGVEPPQAILDFYGVKYLSDPHYAAPMPMFAGLPDVPDSMLERVYDGPQALTSEPMFTADGRPNLQDPRAAWLLMALKRGGSITGVVQQKDGEGEEGGMEGVDGAVQGFAPAASRKEGGNGGKKASFPPVCFVHGTEDVFVPFKLAERAERQAREYAGVGAQVKLVRCEGEGHAFDLRPGSLDVSPEAEAEGTVEGTRWGWVREGVEWAVGFV